MTYPRETVPNRGGIRSLQAYLERTLGDIDAWSNRIDQAIEAITRILELNGVTISWLFDGDTDTTVDPGAGEMRGNTNTMNTWTQVSMSNVDAVGRELDGSQIDQVEAGDTIRINDLPKGLSFYYSMDSDIIDNDTWFQMNVTPLDGASGNPSAGDIMEVTWFPTLSAPNNPAGF